jgi:hypothetical protein
MKKRKLGWITGATALALSTGACGGGGSASPADAGDAGTVDAGSPGGDAAGRDAAMLPMDGSAGGDSDSGGVVAPIQGLRLFYSDLASGPNTGGENGKGAFVTLAGNGFGSTRGASTVTIGGGPADNYPVWSNTKITFQLGSAAATGNLVVNVAGKGASNGLTFTVRAGNIFFVSSAGADTNPGSFASPWASIPYAKNTLQPGDIAYIGTHAGDTVSQTTVDASSSYDCALGMSVNDGTNAGTEAAPKALVAYPGASAIVGVDNGIERGLLAPAITGVFDYWVIAGLTLRGQDEAIDLEGQANGWRIVNNDISCPNGTGETGCVTGNPTQLSFYGNVVHDAAANVAPSAITKYYHGVYWGSSHIDMGWNVVENGKTCRAIQFHDTGGVNEFDLHVHDNIIHDTVCDGLNFATVDPSQGTVEAYNNVIYNVGLGPDPADGASDYAGIYVAGETDSGSAGSGTVQVYGNTLYNCGAWTSSSDSGGVNNGGGNPALSVKLVDNLIVAASTMEAYVAKDAAVGLVTGNNNLLFGGGAVPSSLTATVSGDPKLSNPPMADFHLLSGSAAIGAGVMISDVTDLDGNLRPQNGSWDIGAYEFVP